MIHTESPNRKMLPHTGSGGVVTELQSKVLNLGC